MRFCEVEEGRVKLLLPESPDNFVFYNPRARVSRDVSVLVLRVLSPKECLDGMCASGIRGIRYFSESGVDTVYFNDISEKCVEIAKRNCEINGVTGVVYNEDLNVLLHGESFGCIDIDPFGTPAPFLHSASRSVKHGGILLVTATDTAALCGKSICSGKRKYHAVLEMNEWKKELAVRVLLGNLYTALGIWEKTFEPVVSFVYEHHLRVIVRVKKKKSLITKNSRFLEIYEGLGPIWTGPLHDKDICREAACIGDSSSKKARGILKFASSEVDTVGYFDTHLLFKELGRSPYPLEQVISLLKEHGYLASRTVFSPIGIKTNASREELMHLLS